MDRHNIPPVYDRNSKILILGSFPSIKSREVQFYYGHPRNRFWQVLTAVMGWKNVPKTVDEKKRALLSSGIALWDVIASCDIDGSADSSIRNVIPNDIGVILKTAPVRRIYCSGSKAYELFMKYIYPNIGIRAVKLPSTSPANAARSLDALISEWAVIRDDTSVAEL